MVGGITGIPCRLGLPLQVGLYLIPGALVTSSVQNEPSVLYEPQLSVVIYQVVPYAFPQTQTSYFIRHFFNIFFNIFLPGSSG